MTQLPNGSVLLNMRHKSSPHTGRAIALSHDGGECASVTGHASDRYGPALRAAWLHTHRVGAAKRDRGLTPSLHPSVPPSLPPSLPPRLDLQPDYV